MYDFSFANPVKSRVGRGLFRKVGELTQSQRVMLISDPIVSKLPYYAEIQKLLGGRIVAEYTDIIPNPECENVDDATKLARENKATCIIAVGGGSTLDAAKVVAALAVSEGCAADYVDGRRAFGDKRLELIFMPTTAGTGAEVTNVAVITNRAAGKKVPLVSAVLYGDIAVIDPCLTETMPRKVAAASGFDAFCHAIECYWNKASTPVSDALALYAMKLIVQNIEKAVNDNDADAKENMALASYVAGLAFSQTRTTICHANSYMLTAVYGIEHGTACSLTLLPFMRFNLPVMKEKYDVAGAFVGAKDAEGFIREVDRIYDSVGVERKLSAFGIKAENLPAIAEACLAVGSSKLNARDTSYDEMLEILQGVL